MKTALALLVLVAAATSLQAAAPRVPNDLLRMARSMSLRAVNNAACNDRSRSCSNCNTLNVCAYVAGGYRLLSSSRCPEAAPYCYQGACVKRSPVDACVQGAVVADDFQCVDPEELQGYYPAPFDCTKFYVCSRSVAYVYNCPDDHVYSQAAAGCVRLDQSPGSCSSFNCAANVAQYLLYAPEPSVYAYCVDASTALVSRCADGYRIDVHNGSEPCKPHCSRTGRIADADNPLVYYDCLALGNGTLAAPVEQFCPPGTLFSADRQRCVQDPSASVWFNTTAY